MQKKPFIMTKSNIEFRKIQVNKTENKKEAPIVEPPDSLKD